MRLVATVSILLALSACGLSPASVVLSRGSWTSLQHDESGRFDMTLVGLQDGRVLLVGGSLRNGKSSATTEIYDPHRRIWSSASEMPVAVVDPTATLLADGRVLLAGGETNAQTGLATNTAAIFDPVRDTWTKAAPMIQGRFLHGAIRLVDGRVLVVGGNTSATSQAASAEVFDPAADKWTSVPPMPTERLSPLAAVVPDGRVVVTGGSVPQLPSVGPQTPPTSTVEPPASVYDPVKNEWSSLNFPPAGNVVKSLFLNGAGELVGFIYKYQQPTSDEGVSTPADVFPFVFDIRTDAARVGPKMPAAAAASAFSPVNIPDTLLRDGRLLTFDGSRALLYDPTANSWSVAPSPPSIPTIYGPTSLLLGDGRVFISSGNYVYLFDPDAVITGPSPADIGSPGLSRWLSVIAVLMIIAVGIQFLWSRRTIGTS